MGSIVDAPTLSSTPNVRNCNTDALDDWNTTALACLSVPTRWILDLYLQSATSEEVVVRKQRVIDTPLSVPAPLQCEGARCIYRHGPYARETPF